MSSAPAAAPPPDPFQQIMQEMRTMRSEINAANSKQIALANNITDELNDIKGQNKIRDGDTYQLKVDVLAMGNTLGDRIEKKFEMSQGLNSTKG